MITFDDFTSIHSLSNLGIIDNNIYFQTNRADLVSNSYINRIYIINLSDNKVVEEFDLEGLKIIGHGDVELYLSCQRDNTTDVYTWDIKSKINTKILSSSNQILAVKSANGTVIALGNKGPIEPHLPDSLLNLKRDADLYHISELPFSYNGKGYIPGIVQKLYLLTSDKDLEQLSPSNIDVSLFRLSQDGQDVYFVGQEKNGLDRENHQLYKLNIESRKLDILYNLDTIHYIHNMTVYEDFVYFTSCDASDLGYGQSPDLIVMNRHNGEIVNKYNFDRSIGVDEITTDTKFGDHDLFQCNQNGIIFGMTDHYRTNLYKIDSHQLTKLIDFDGSVLSFVPCGDKIYFIGQEVAGLDELYLYSDNKVEECTYFNASYLRKAAPNKPEHYLVDNQEFNNLDAFVIKPQEFIPGKSYPAILDIHGGPRMAYGDGFFHEMQLWSSSGYFVVYGNPRGSAGRGDSFANARKGRMAYEPFDDLMAILDEAIRLYPEINKDKLYVTGGSYGGYMTNWIVGHTNRFKAAVSQRSITNWTSQTFQTDVANVSFSRFTHDAEDIWENIDMLWDLSPLKYARNISTPLMFIHSMVDLRCPFSQAVQLYNALKILNKDTELNLFIGENHELSRSGKPINRAARLALINDWFKKYNK